MSICLVAGSLVTQLAVGAFTLSWMHSVERTQWEEDWRVVDGQLEPQMARIKGSGAGMEPPEDAVLKDGWWTYRPQIGKLPALHLADGGTALTHFRLCSKEGCRQLFTDRDQHLIVIKACGLENGAPVDQLQKD